MSEEKKVKKLTIRVEEDLHKKLQHYVIDHDITIQDLTIKYYQELVNENN
ncbi:MAG: hypothetical protein RR448_11160 [Niameybacter sp.]